MNINRNNYESFFLLYVDDELSDAEKKSVQLFLHQNPDLLSEFNALQQCVLVPSSMNYTDKNTLLKSDDFTITQHNLLLFLDNELNPVQESEIKDKIENDSFTNKEWEILQQTKVSADLSIQFKNKASLYKKETAKFISFDWKKLSIAAMILGAGIWIGIKYSTSSDKIGAAIATTLPALPQSINFPVNLKKNNTISIKTHDQFAKNNIIEKRSNTQHHPTLKNEQPNNFVAKQPFNSNTNTHLGNINNSVSNKAPLSDVSPKTNNVALAKNNAPVLTDKQIIIQPNNEAESNPSFAANASYNEDESDDKILYMDEAQIKRTKLGGLFRKAKRILERTTHIKTGEGIKLAGFEIALK